jgi:hypothetical protein
MVDNDNGPPESERPAPPQDRPSRNNTDAPDTTAQPDIKPGSSLVWIPCTCWSSPQDVDSQLKRRRGEKNRSVPLSCGCRDPWTCRCYTTEPPLTDNQLDGWVAAANHVLAQGQMPLVPIEVRRALWKRAADRTLAERLHEGCGGGWSHDRHRSWKLRRMRQAGDVRAGARALHVRRDVHAVQPAARGWPRRPAP